MTFNARSTSPLIAWICLGALAVVLLNVVRSAPGIAEILLGGDADDLMRLQQLRDWLAGQAWFDTRQYRVLPPEGISIHWSRYIDAGLAAIYVPASWFLSALAAEQAVLILWPTLLAIGMVLVIGPANARLMGPAAAIGALVVFLTWSKLGGEFAVGRIDHHNAQMLCATAIFYLSVLPGRPRLRGALAGGLLALSLAIGLEMLPFLAVIWGLMILRHAFGEAGLGDWLVAFCLGLAGAAPVLMAGQTPVAAWGVMHCDVLAPPVMTLALVGIVATLAPVLLARQVTHPLGRMALALGLTAGGIWLAAPVLLPCLAGPYAEVAPEVRIIIETRVVEALSAIALLQSDPALLARVLLPPVVITLLALGTAWHLRRQTAPGLRVALIQAFVIVAVGLAFALVQLRAANLMVPAVPLLGGFLVQAFAGMPRDSRLRAPAMLALVLAMPAVTERASGWIDQPRARLATTATEAGQVRSGAGAALHCRTPEAMAEIASLPPPAVVFTSLNLGPAVVVFTPHAATSASYHRSAAAFWNGIGPFADPAAMASALATSGADYLVLCSGSSEEGLVPDLPPWLAEVTGDRQAVRVFQVDRAATIGAAP